MTEFERVKSISPNPVSADIYLTVLSRIQRGEIREGSKVVDTVLAGEFGVSRMPARQALLRLVHEGYLVGTTRGFALPQLNDRDVAEIFEVRSLLEPRAAASACPLLDEADISQLVAAFEEAARAQRNGQVPQLMEANNRFRQVWLNKVPNQRLASAIQRFADHVQVVRSRTVIDPATQEVVLALSRALLEAFKQRDSLKVHDLTAEFLKAAQDSYFIAKPHEAKEYVSSPA